MTVVVRAGRISARISSRTLLCTAVVLTAAIAIVVVSLGAGDFPIPPDRIIAALAGGGSAQESLIVLQLRLPRVLLALLVGALLALSGAIVQTTARNALASPDLLGVTGGASAAAVAVIVLGGSTGFSSVLQAVGTTTAALVGGLAAAAIVAAVLRGTRGGALQIILVGVGVSALFSGLTSWLVVEASIDDAERASAWLMGSVGGRGVEEVWLAAGALAAVLVLLIPLSSRLGALQLGADAASSLGHDVRRVSTALLLASVVLASIAAAVAGPIGFIALVAPHIARFGSGASRPPLGLSAAVGGTLVVGSDLIARTLFAPLVLPTGAVTAIVGAPFLLWLLIRERKGTPS